MKMSNNVQLHDCDAFMSGKMCAFPFSKSEAACDEKLYIVYYDIVGPMQHEAISGAK